MNDLVCPASACRRRYRVRGLRPGRTMKCRSCGTELIAESAETILHSPGAIVPPAVAGRDGEGPFGRYVDVRPLAEGGMGAILRAVDPLVGRPVAIKVLHDGLEDEMGDRFLREARITGQLEHPNIPPLHEIARTSDGRLYFAMKLIEGRSLSEALADGDLPLRRLVGDLIKVADAVAYAHSKRIVHRDLKPENIMTGAFGEVLVMDWGLARELEPEDEPGTTSSVDLPGFKQTLAGTVLGTPHYMPPEQALGQLDRIDARSDVYSLGAVLYEILTGQPPVDGPSIESVLHQVKIGRLVSPRERLGGVVVSRELEAIAMRALSYRRRNRYPSVEAFRDDLQAFLDGFAVGAADYNPFQLASKWFVRHRAVASAGVAIAAVVLGAGALLLWQAGRRRAVEIEDAVAAAEAAIEGVGGADELTAPGGRRGETVEATIARETSLDAYLAAASALDRALALDPGDPELRARRRAIGTELGRIACLGGDYSLARRAYLDLRQVGATAEEVETLLDEVDRARRAIEDRQADRLEEILSDIRAGLSRDGRDPAGPCLDDHVFEALGYRSLRAVDILSRALRPIVAAAAGPGFVWTEGPSDLVRFACRVLGRLGVEFPEAVRPLAEVLTVVEEPELAVEAGRALCNTRQPTADAPLARARARLGVDSEVWRRIEPLYGRVPVAVGGEPVTAEDWFLRAQARGGRGDVAGAVEAYTRAIDLDGRYAEALVNRALLWKATGDLAAARDDLDRAIAIRPGLLEALANRGIVRRLAGDPAGAAADLTRAIELAPERVELWLERGEARRAEGDHVAALADINQAIRLAPDSALARLRRGQAREDRGNLSGALMDYRKAIELDPRLAGAYSYLGHGLLAAGDAAGAGAAFTRALGLDPRLGQAWLGRGIVRLRGGDPRGAIGDLDRAAQLLDDAPRVPFERGNAWLATGDPDRAIEDFRRSLAIDPAFYPAATSLGVALAGLGRRDEARQAFEQARQHAPASVHPQIDQAVERLLGG